MAWCTLRIITGPLRSTFPFGLEVNYFIFTYDQYLARSYFTPQIFINNLPLNLYFCTLVTKVYVFTAASIIKRYPPIRIESVSPAAMSRGGLEASAERAYRGWNCLLPAVSFLSKALLIRAVSSRLFFFFYLLLTRALSGVKYCLFNNNIYFRLIFYSLGIDLANLLYYLKLILLYRVKRVKFIYKNSLINFYFNRGYILGKNL
jgi:hypothetical protein